MGIQSVYIAPKKVKIPTHIVEDILCHLPVKPLKRFRCVAKSWRSWIDSEIFIKLHLNMSLKTMSHQHLIALGHSGIFDVDLTGNTNAGVLKLPFSSSNVTGISGSCNGLFLVVGEPLVIWNPFTKEFKTLPAIGDADLPVPLGCFSRTAYGLAYDSRNNDYKVVRVVSHMETSSRIFVPSQGHIYSLKLNSWKLIAENFTYPAVKHWPTHINGSLHTLAFDSTKIMAFSVESEKHHELQLPSRISTGEDVYLALYEIGGRLCVIRASCECTEVWVMQDYNKTESWMKKLSTDGMNQGALDGGAMKPLVYIMDGHIAIFRSGINSSFICHAFGEAEKKGIFYIKGLPMHLYNVEACVESLVMLPGEKQVQTQGQVHDDLDKKLGNKEQEERDDSYSWFKGKLL